MTTESPFAELERLNKEILHHAHLYFNKDKPSIPNHVYDDLVIRFNELREQHPEFDDMFEIQNKPVPIHEPTGVGLEVVKFTNPMLSLRKAVNKEQFTAFSEKFVDDEFFDEYKLDGLALELVYSKLNDKELELVSMTTRGDGEEGEDVTHSLPLFRNIPKKLRAISNCPDTLVVRGEAYMTIFDFEIYNDIAIKKKTTPRNAAAGFVRALEKNMDVNALNLLDFNVYWSDTNFGAEKYSGLRHKWTLLGFYVAPEAHPNDIENNKQLRNIPVDGIVRKINKLARWDELGVTNKYPNYAIAYKFPNEEVETSPLSIDWQVGKTGRVTPCVNYLPVKLGGVVCDRASLDNIYQFLSLGLRQDSVIIVSRNGDVIPRLHKIVTHGKGKLFEAPTECPSCSSVLETRKSKNSAELVCNNVAGCPAQLLMRCAALVDKRCLDIEDLGPVKLGQLIDAGVIEQTSDVLWHVKEKHVGEKIYKRIQAALYQPWHIVIKALGLPGIDLTRAKKLANALPSSIINGDVTTIAPGINQVAAQTEVLSFLSKPENVMAIPGFSTGLALPIAVMLRNEDAYENARDILRILHATSEESPDLLIKGVVTGSLGQSREELIEFFAGHGIELVDNLTRDCQFLLKGERPSKSKILKATELGIPMVNGVDGSSIEKIIQTIKGEVQ